MHLQRIVSAPAMITSVKSFIFIIVWSTLSLSFYISARCHVFRRYLRRCLGYCFDSVCLSALMRRPGTTWFSKIFAARACHSFGLVQFLTEGILRSRLDHSARDPAASLGVSCTCSYSHDLHYNYHSSTPQTVTSSSWTCLVVSVGCRRARDFPASLVIACRGPWFWFRRAFHFVLYSSHPLFSLRAFWDRRHGCVLWAWRTSDACAVFLRGRSRWGPSQSKWSHAASVKCWRTCRRPSYLFWSTHRSCSGFDLEASGANSSWLACQIVSSTQSWLHYC